MEMFTVSNKKCVTFYITQNSYQPVGWVILKLKHQLALLHLQFTLGKENSRKTAIVKMMARICACDQDLFNKFCVSYISVTLKSAICSKIHAYNYVYNFLPSIAILITMMVTWSVVIAAACGSTSNAWDWIETTSRTSTSARNANHEKSTASRRMSCRARNES